MTARTPPPAAHQPLRDRAARAVFWSSVQTWGGQLVSVVTFLLLARLLQPADFGLVALAGVVIAFVQTFADQGFAQAIIQRPDLDRKHLDTAFWSSLAFSCVLGAIVVGLASPISEVFNQPDLEGVLQVLALAFPLIGLTSVQESILRREMLFATLAGRTLAANTVGGVVGVTLAALGLGVWSLVAQLLATRAVGVVVLWSASRWRPGLRFSPRHFRQLFSFGISVVGTNALNFFNRRTDDLLIGYFLGTTALGYYTVAYRVLRIMTNLLTVTVSQVALPTFSRLQHDRQRVVRVFYTATEMTSLVSFPTFVTMAVLAPQVVEVLFGSHWGPSVRVMQVLAGVGIIHSVFFFNGAVLTALGKPSWVLALTGVNAAANVVAFAITVQWGIVWVAAAYVIRAYVLSPLPVRAVRRLIGIDVGVYLRRFAAPVLASAVMAGVELGLRQALGGSPVAALLVVALAGAVVYLVTLRATAPAAAARAVSLAGAAVPRLQARRAAVESAPPGTA